MKTKKTFKNPKDINRKFKKNFKDLLEENKKLVLILMFVVIILGIIRLLFIRNNTAKAENINEASFVKLKETVFKPNSIGLMDAIDLYSEIKELDVKDSLKIIEMNNKLDKIIDK